MEHITANAVIRHIGKAAGFAKHPHRLHEVEVDGATGIEFALDAKGIMRGVLGDWAIAYDDPNGIVTVTAAADGKRSVYYVHWLPDRYLLAGWLYHRVG